MIRILPDLQLFIRACWHIFLSTSFKRVNSNFAGTTVARASLPRTRSVQLLRQQINWIIDNWRTGIHFFLFNKKHLLLSISTAYNVISCKKIQRNNKKKNRLLCKFCSQAQKSLKIPTKKNFALNRGLLKFFHLCQLLQAVASFHSYHMMSPVLTRQGTSSHYQYCYLDIVI